MPVSWASSLALVWGYDPILNLGVHSILARQPE